MKRRWPKAATSLLKRRARMLAALDVQLAILPKDPFPVPDIVLAMEGPTNAQELRESWRASRRKDAGAGRTLTGPHRADLVVHNRANGQAADRCSTGEQKALMLSLILAHAALVSAQRGAPPILLLDEVAAHLDPDRRAALFERLGETGAQVWMTVPKPRCSTQSALLRIW